MTKGNEWAMKFEAIAGKLANAQYANLANFFNAAIADEREACAQVADAWVWPSTHGEKPDSDLASHVAGKIARKIRARSKT